MKFNPEHDYICKICGSNDLTFAVELEWDATHQRLTIPTVPDEAHCNYCDADAELHRIQIGEVLQ